MQAFGTGKPSHSGFLFYIDHASADQVKARGSKALENDALAALRVLDLAGLFHAVRSRCAWAWWDAKKADEELAEKRRVEEKAMSKVDRSNHVFQEKFIPTSLNECSI
jgi:hypothetical protein